MILALAALAAGCLDQPQEPAPPPNFVIILIDDLGWISEERWEALPEDVEASPFAPEICVEVLSSANTDAEMEAKRRLYFEGGAREVWLCDEGGQMTFYVAGEEKPVARSLLIPGFPSTINEG